MTHSAHNKFLQACGFLAVAFDSTESTDENCGIPTLTCEPLAKR